MAIQKQSAMERIKAAAAKAKAQVTAPSGSTADPRLYKPAKNQSGANTIVLRLIPSAHDETHILKYDMYSNYEGGFNFMSPSKDDKTLNNLPAKEAWKAFRNGNRDLMKKLLPNQRFLTNVFIIKDTVTPENNGKVFMLDFGRQLEDTINKVISGELGIDGNPFDLLGDDGASLNLNWTITSPPNQKFPKYSFTFTEDGGAFGKRPDLEKIFDSTHNLSAYVDTNIEKPTQELLNSYYNFIMGETDAVVNTPVTYGKPAEAAKPQQPATQPPVTQQAVAKNQTIDPESFDFDDDIPF